MNKQEFLRRLKEDLTSFTEEELQGALKYYDEFFADAHEEEVERNIAEYNEKEDVKENIKYSVPPIKKIKNKEPKNKKSKNTLLLVLLICFSPVLIPLIMSFGMVLFSLFMAFLSISIAFGCVALSGLVAAGAGVFSVGYGIVQLFFFDVSGALLAISVGLVSTGVGIILAYLFGKLTFFTIKYEFKFLGFMGRKIKASI
ncbi:MAG: DUF1700 domain-containing protein [Oscillospiraceae bacterium]|nr:DUF1700 domain-containing protein [Oscillospiraceae bacterium]